MNISNIFERMYCYNLSCEQLYKEFKIIRKKWLDDRLSFLIAFDNKKITPDNFIKEINKINNNYFYSKIYKDFKECSIINCYDHVKLE